MSVRRDTRDVILRYWKSWQKQDWDELRDCLADEVRMGEHAVSADAFTQMCRLGPPWRDVELLHSVFTDGHGSLLYEGTDTRTGRRIRVGEFIDLEDGRVARSVACFGGGDLPQEK